MDGLGGGGVWESGKNVIGCIFDAIIVLSPAL